jgi:hypothetical protein
MLNIISSYCALVLNSNFSMDLVLSEKIETCTSKYADFKQSIPKTMEKEKLQKCEHIRRTNRIKRDKHNKGEIKRRSSKWKTSERNRENMKNRTEIEKN